jgi:homoserine O-succinyltransferase
MPLIIEGGRIPTRWAEKRNQPPMASKDNHAARDCVHLALINNMPDPALEDTELQFFQLLDTASGDIPVLVKLYSLAGVPRTDRGQRHLNSFYFNFDDLWNSRFDGVIVTGTEPVQPNLHDEPYWTVLTQVLDWAAENTSSTVLSCLAAHASVLHSDGVKRHKLPDKRFGVFDSNKVSDHLLTNRLAGRIRFPHSRWNEVQADELTVSGYKILTESAGAGVDVFVKTKKRSLFVHFQGHPEYSAQTLLKEYRRDIKRFLRRERETYPTMPAGYFDQSATLLLNDFRESVILEQQKGAVSSFPQASVVQGLQNSWQSSATCVYSKWLQYLVSRKNVPSPFALMDRHRPAPPDMADGEIA